MNVCGQVCTEVRCPKSISSLGFLRFISDFFAVVLEWILQSWRQAALKIRGQLSPIYCLWKGCNLRYQESLLDPGSTVEAEFGVCKTANSK